MNINLGMDSWTLLIQLVLVVLMILKLLNTTYCNALIILIIVSLYLLTFANLTSLLFHLIPQHCVGSSFLATLPLPMTLTVKFLIPLLNSSFLQIGSLDHYLTNINSIFFSFSLFFSRDCLLAISPLVPLRECSL